MRRWSEFGGSVEPRQLANGYTVTTFQPLAQPLSMQSNTSSETVLEASCAWEKNGIRSGGDWEITVEFCKGGNLCDLACRHVQRLAKYRQEGVADIFEGEMVYWSNPTWENVFKAVCDKGLNTKRIKAQHRPPQQVVPFQYDGNTKILMVKVHDGVYTVRYITS